MPPLKFNLEASRRDLAKYQADPIKEKVALRLRIVETAYGVLGNSKPKLVLCDNCLYPT